MPYTLYIGLMRIPKTPIDIVAEEGLTAGSTPNFQVVSDESAVYLQRTADAPDSNERGIRLEFGDPPYPMTVLADPGKIWVWAETGPAADLEYIIH